MKKETDSSQGYGLLSMMALTMGIVIGSGIFAMNAELIKTNGSILLTSISWIIGSLLVMTMLVAFLEIISITDILDEQATLSNWGKQLLGIRFGKSVGYFMTLIYTPMLIAGLMSISSRFGLETVDMIIGEETILGGSWTEYFSIAGATVIIMLLIGFSNANFKKPGKYFQNIGIVIKIVPLIFIISLFVVMLIIGDINFVANSEYLKDNPSANVASRGNFSLIFLTLPAILFSFDGFLLAGPLSKEGKNKSTFRISFIISILAIVAIYILFSIATLGLGDAKEDNYGTISNAIHATFNNDTTARVIAIIVQILLTTSLLAGVSGLTICGARMMSDLSSHNSLKDESGSLITKNKHGVSTTAGKYTLITSFFWLSIYQIMNAINISQGAGTSLDLTFYSLNLVVIFAFILYGIVMVGGIVNRFTKKIEVKENILFLPFAIISSIFTFAITIYFAVDTILPLEYWNNPNEYYSWAKYGTKLAMLSIFIIFTIVVIFYNLNKTNNLDEELVKFKKNKSEIYYKIK